MFMQFRGGGVGHLGTRHVDSRLKGDNYKLGDEQQDNDSYLHEELGSGTQEDLEMHEEETGQRENTNEQDEDEDECEDEGGDLDMVNESDAKASGNTDDGKDTDDEDHEKNDNEILDEEGFAEL